MRCRGKVEIMSGHSEKKAIERGTRGEERRGLMLDLGRSMLAIKGGKDSTNSRSPHEMTSF